MARIQIICEHKDRKHVAHGLCSVCYWRKWRTGDIERKYKNYSRHLVWQDCKEARALLGDANVGRDIFKQRHCILQRYRITLVQFVKQFFYQKSSCACGRLFGKDCKPEIDHNHITGKFRGLLCDKCNKVLGILGEDVRLLPAYLVNYLQQGLYDSN